MPASFLSAGAIIHKALDGLGYVRPFEKSKNLRDAHSGVKIEFLLSGDYPGDGKPKAVQFPDPGRVAVDHDGIKFVDLATLIELKLASGMSGSDRMKDLADVQELIKRSNLPQDFQARLDESVRGKYLELWVPSSIDKEDIAEFPDDAGGGGPAWPG
jgi:hypothetical protein